MNTKRSNDYMYFEVIEEHLKLLPEMYIGWNNCEFGAPEIDCKRPYGNSGVYSNMRKILGGEYETRCPRCEEILDSKFDNKRLDQLHKEMGIVLQILLHIFPKPLLLGKYQKLKYGNKWEYASK